MPNHVHTILGANNGNISNILRDYKQYTSRKITETLRQRGKVQILSLFKSAAKHAGRSNQYKVWQSSSHPQLMDYDEKLFQKTEYIHHNPVRKGFVEDPENWAYSSARNYISNGASIIEIQKLW
jgi:REP element-mobilizing transposase RayT